MPDLAHLQALAVALAARHPSALDVAKAPAVAAEVAAAAAAIWAELPAALAATWKATQAEARTARVASLLAAAMPEATAIESTDDGGVIVRFDPPREQHPASPSVPVPDWEDMAEAQRIGDTIRAAVKAAKEEAASAASAANQPTKKEDEP